MDIFRLLHGDKSFRISEKFYAELVKKTRRPVMKLELANATPLLIDSKIGGIPYLPYNSEVPSNNKGDFLYLLAQINCEDLSGLYNFPQSGLLQFFIAANDFYGADFDYPTKQDGFRIIYHKDVDMGITEKDVRKRFPILQNPNSFPVIGSYGVKFFLEAEEISVSDFEFDSIFTESYNAHFRNHKISGTSEISEDTYDILADKYSGFGHKIGGYPGFTQEDPRSYENGLGKLDTVLLQIDSEFGEGFERTMWGDSGICNFFINSDALFKCDFSNVAYNWDCY